MLKGFSGGSFVPLTTSVPFATSFSDNYKEPVNGDFDNCTLRSRACHMHYPGNSRTEQSPVILDLFLRKTRAGNDVIFVTSFSKSSVSKIFLFTRVQMRGRRFRLISSGLKSVVEEYRFPDGSVWTVGGVTIETKLRFQILPAWCGLGLKKMIEKKVIQI